MQSYENRLKKKFLKKYTFFAWLHLGLGPHDTGAPRPYKTGPLCPMSNHGSLVTLLKFQTAPKFLLLISYGSKKNEHRYAWPSEVKASHSQRKWAEFSSFTPHLHSGLSSSTSRWRCLLRVLCPVRRPVTALERVLLKDRNLAFVPHKIICTT